MPRFSVIIPVYNVENYLNRCVGSVCNQSFKDLEIILVDDGSTDRCPAMCDILAKKDPRIRVIHKKMAALASRATAVSKRLPAIIFLLSILMIPFHRICLRC